MLYAWSRFKFGFYVLVNSASSSAASDVGGVYFTLSFRHSDAISTLPHVIGEGGAFLRKVGVIIVPGDESVHQDETDAVPAVLIDLVIVECQR